MHATNQFDIGTGEHIFAGMDMFWQKAKELKSIYPQTRGLDIAKQAKQACMDELPEDCWKNLRSHIERGIDIAFTQCQAYHRRQTRDLLGLHGAKDELS